MPIASNASARLPPTDMPVNVVTLAPGSIFQTAGLFYRSMWWLKTPQQPASRSEMDPLLYGEIWIFLLLWLGAWELIGNSVDGTIDVVSERSPNSLIAKHPRSTKLLFYGFVIILATILIFTLSTDLGFREASGVHHEPLLFQG